MIDIQHETLVPLNAAKIPGNPSSVTRWRWKLKGVRGCQLETATVGNRVFTSIEAIGRFIDGCSASHSRQVPLRSPAKREAAIRRAEAELTKAGI